MLLNPYRFGSSGSYIRPVFRSNSAASTESGTLSVPLPAGWAVGDLGILHIGSTSASAISITGWTEITSRSSTNGMQRTYYRILQSGDGAASVPNVGKRAALMLAFEALTFDGSNPVAVLSGASDSGTGTSVTSPASDSVAALPYFRIQAINTNRATFYTDTTTYPFAALQLVRSTGGSFPFPVIYMSGGNFDGGIDPSSSFVRPASESWASYKILIRPRFA